MLKRHPLQIGPSRSLTRKPDRLWAEPWMVWRENGWRELTCPACHDTHLMPKRIDANPPFKPRERYALYQCEACGTLHYPDARVFEYESRRDADLARKFYLEVGAGLDAMISPLAWTGLDGVKSFLEVGGGYGFSVDFASRELGWTAANIDPSFLARTGARDLGHRHVPAYLAPDHALADNSHDRVLSSEVIEHVKDPDPFLDALGSALSPDGILLLTTPNAAVVTPEAGLDRLLPVITAGHHLVIFSRAGLEATLRRAGYAHVTVEENGMTLLAAASHKAFETDFASRPDRDRLQSYLAGRLDALGSDHALFAAFAVRLLKEYVHTAQWDSAAAVRDRIRRRWRADYGFDLDKPAGLTPEFVRTEKGGRRRIRKFAANFPFSLTTALYYAACLDRQAGDTGRALEGFDAAARIGTTLQTVFSAMYAACRETEDLTIRSRLAAAELGADQDPARATRQLQRIFGEIGPAMQPEWMRIACRVLAAGTLTGRAGAVAAITAAVRGHVDARLQAGDPLSPAEGYAAAGLAQTQSVPPEQAGRWWQAAATAMTDPAERDVFRRRAEAATPREPDPGQAFIDAVNAGDGTSAIALAERLKAAEGTAHLTQPVAFALGIHHLNLQPDPGEALKWFTRAAEQARGDDRLDAMLHQAMAAERLPESERGPILANLLAHLQKARPESPHLGSRITEMTARYSAQVGTREAAG